MMGIVLERGPDGQSTRTELKCRTSRGGLGLVMGIVLECGPDGQSTRTELKYRTSRGWFGLVMGIVLERGPDGHDGAVGIESSGMLETEVGGYT